jgi:hypothetical protein
MTTSAIGTVELPSVQSLIELSQAISGDGVERHVTTVRALVRSARGLGIAPVLCQVALDPGAPGSVRERAVTQLIGRVAHVCELRTSTQNDITQGKVQGNA